MPEHLHVLRPEPSAVAFGPFVLDRSDASLWRGDQRILLTPKAYQLLELLVRHAGELVSKALILREVWPQTFVTDAVVKVCVAQLRRALGDSAHEPCWIANEPRRGYRFIGRVTPVRGKNLVSRSMSHCDSLGIEASLPDAAPEHVLERALEAADRAAAELDYATCASQLAIACTTARFLLPEDDASIHALRLRLGGAARRAGDRAAAHEAIASAIAQARISGERERFAHAVLALGAGHQSILRCDPSLIELLEEALRELPDADAPLRACVEARLAFALISDPSSSERRRALMRSARRRARASASLREQAFVLRYRVWAGWGPDDLRLRLASSYRLEQLGERHGECETRLHALGLRISAALEAVDAKCFEQTLGSYVQLAEASRQPWFEWAALRFRILHAMLLDRFDVAERCIGDGLARARTLDHPDVLALFYAQRVALRLQQGRHQEVLNLLEHGLRGAVPSASWRCALAYARAAVGDRAGAAALLSELCADDLRSVPRDALWKGSLTLLADACAWIGDRRLARALYDALSPYADHFAVLYGFACLGSVHRPLGRLAARLGRRAAARRPIELAIALHRRFGAVGWEARTRHERDRELGTACIRPRALAVAR